MNILLLLLIYFFDSSSIDYLKYPSNKIFQNFEKKFTIINKLNSENWIERAEGLNLITDKELKDKEIKNLLIKLLEKEIEFRTINNELEDFPWESWTESYYFKLVVLIANIKEEQVIPILIETLNWTSSRKVKEILSEMGEPAVKPLIKALQDRRKKRGAIYYLEAIVSRDNKQSETISDSARQLIKDNIIELLKSREPGVRIDAIRVLAKFRESEVKIYLQNVSEKDPYFVIKKVNGIPQKVYPVRNEAKKQLQLIKEN